MDFVDKTEVAVAPIAAPASLAFVALVLAACSARPREAAAVLPPPFEDQSFGSSGQLWNTGLRADPHGGFVVAGIFDGDLGLDRSLASRNPDAFVAWFDDAGGVRRAVHLPGPDTETGAELAVDAEGAAIVLVSNIVASLGAAPPARGGFPPRPRLEKLDRDGRRLWSVPLPPAMNRAVAVDRHGNVYVSGATAHYQPGNCEVIQWSRDGRERWRRTLLEGSARCTGQIRRDPARDLVWVVVERGGPAEPLGSSTPRDVRAIGFTPSGEARGEVRLRVDDWQGLDAYEPLSDGGVLLVGHDRDLSSQRSVFWGLAGPRGPVWLRRMETPQLSLGGSVLEPPGARAGWLLAGKLAGPLVLGGDRLEAGTDRRSVLLALDGDGRVSRARLLPGEGDEYAQQMARLTSGRVVLVSTRAGRALHIYDVTAIASELQAP